MADIIRPVLAGRVIKFAVPFEPKHYRNPKYINTLLAKRDYLVSLLPESTYTKTYLIGNLFEYKKYNDDPFNNDTINFEQYTDEFYKTTKSPIDLVISDGRLPQNDINNREKLRSTLKYRNKIFDDAFKTQSGIQTIHFPDGHRHEGFDKDYIYRGGKLYAPVFVGEPLVIFEDEYSIPNNIAWTTETLVNYENNLLVDSLEYMEYTNECSCCEFANLCIGRGVIRLMKTLNLKTCSAPKAAFAYARPITR
jgi:hypothetical protein